MRDFNSELSAYGLTKETYEACLEDIKEKHLGINDMDWQEIIEKYNLNIHYDTLRKASQTIFGNIFVTDYYKDKYARESSPSAYLGEIKQAKIELAKEKQKIRDEKLEFNRWLREDARDERIYELLRDEIKKNTPIRAPKIIKKSESEIVGALCIADQHYGTEFKITGLNNEIINEYNPEIFENRMEELLNDVIHKIKKENLKAIKIYSLGDELDGILRVSQLSKLKYGVIESAIRYSQYMTKWLNALTEFVRVEFYMAFGNHTELRLINQPKGTFVEENMGKIIKQFLEVSLEGNPNFELKTTDNGLIFDRIFNFNLLGIHGEVKNMANAIETFSNIYDTKIDILLAGHKHHFKTETVGHNRDVVNVPSIIGVDDFSMSIGKTSNAGATFIIIDKAKGLTEITTFKFTR